VFALCAITVATPGHKDQPVYAGGLGDSALERRVSVEALTIDLTTSEPLKPTDIFPHSNTPEGAAEIATRVNDANPQGLCGDQQVSDTLPLELTPESFTGGSSESGVLIGLTHRVGWSSWRD
jgi:hypothetical protein